MRDLLVPLNGPDLIQGLEVRGETAVHAQDALVDDLRCKSNVLQCNTFAQDAPFIWRATESEAVQAKVHSDTTEVLVRWCGAQNRTDLTVFTSSR